jgi:putative ABC transport system permease protein
MRIQDLVGVSLGNLRRTRGRTLMSILGIVIGIMSVILVLSIGEAARSYIVSQIDSFGSDFVFVESGPPAEVESGGVPNPFPKQVLTTSDYRKLARQSWMEYSTANTQNMDRAEFNGQSINVTVYGTTQDEVPMYGMRIEKGSFFTLEDVNSRANVVVLGKSIADNLFGVDDPIGKNVKINKQNFRVAGVMAKSGARFLVDLDRMVYVPYTAAMDLYGLKNVVYLVAKTDLPLREAVEQVRIAIRDNHHIDNPNDDDFRVLTQEDAVKSVEQITGILQIFLTSVAAISLLVGGIGIMNIMYVTVTERTREIGLRKALGARRGDILGQFVVEAAVLTTLGGAVGVALGVGLTWIAITIIQSFQDGWVFQLSTDGIILGVGVSTVIGIVFGYFPARRAARLSPIEALRHE